VPLCFKKPLPLVRRGVKLTARDARDQLNVAYASPLPLPGGPLRAPPNKGNGADCGVSRHEQVHADPHARSSSATLWAQKPYKYIDACLVLPYLNHITKRSDFEWDFSKDKLNREKHGVSFALAQLAFLDHNRVILEDLEHSDDENRYYCLGKVASEIMTVRFTYRKKSEL